MTTEELQKTEEVNSWEPTETWRILKNVVVIGVAFMVHFTAYSGAVNLQSSINSQSGLGTASLAAVFGAFIFSNIFLPAVIIKCLGTKWAIGASFITYMPYIAAQLYPTFYTLIPTGIIMGLGGGPLWCAKCKYISVVSEVSSKISRKPAGVLLVQLLGIFYMIYQLSQVWGNLISSLVISSGENAAAVTVLNASMISKVCGANFLPSANSEEALQQQPAEKIQTLAGIYLACMAGAALIVAVGLDSIKRYEINRNSLSDTSGLAVLAVTLKLLREPNQRLLIIINIFIGFQEAFFGTDFTAAFVSCAVGTGSVGFVMMAYGSGNTLGCIVTGYLANIIGRLRLICTASVIHMGLFVTILVWRPRPGLGFVLYVIGLLWGLSDSIWTVQMNAYYGILFAGREEAAYSNFTLWLSVGFIIAYVISPYLLASSKTYLMMAMLVVGLIGYFVVELRDRKNKKYLESTTKVEDEVNSRSHQTDCLKGCNNIAFIKVE